MEDGQTPGHVVQKNHKWFMTFKKKTSHRDKIYIFEKPLKNDMNKGFGMGLSYRANIFIFKSLLKMDANICQK